MTFELTEFQRWKELGANHAKAYKERLAREALASQIETYHEKPTEAEKAVYIEMFIRTLWPSYLKGEGNHEER